MSLQPNSSPSGANNQDPTALTRVAVDAAKEELRLQYDNAIASMGNLFDAKLSALQKLTDERIDGLKTAFREDKIAATTAVSAAFAAQEKLNVAQNFANATATTKSETYFTKEIDAVKGLVALNQERVKSEIANLSERMNRDQGAMLGAQQQVDNRHAGLGTNISGVIMLTAIAAVMISLWGTFGSSHQASAPAVLVPPPVTISPTH